MRKIFKNMLAEWQCLGKSSPLPFERLFIMCADSFMDKRTRQRLEEHRKNKTVIYKVVRSGMEYRYTCSSWTTSKTTMHGFATSLRREGITPIVLYAYIDMDTKVIIPSMEHEVIHYGPAVGVYNLPDNHPKVSDNLSNRRGYTTPCPRPTVQQALELLGGD